MFDAPLRIPMGNTQAIRKNTPLNATRAFSVDSQKHLSISLRTMRFVKLA